MSVAGVDYDTFGVYIAQVDAELELGETIILGYRDKSREKDARYAFEAALRIPRAIVAAYSNRPLPELAFVERATGASRRSDFLLGRVQGLVAAGLQLAGVTVQELRASDWKRELTGNGNAPKALAHERLRAIYVEAANGQKGLTDENVRDALAIAYTGAKRQLFEVFE